jgi:integration host factor subunit beta
MTKSVLIELLAEKANIPKVESEKIVNSFFDAMVDALKRGESIEIRGFGSFRIRNYKPYTGRNPKTNQSVAVPAKRLPFFRVGKELKEFINKDMPSSKPLPSR